MESNSEQLRRNTNESEDNKATHEGLPMESSPYLKYNDLEEYKHKAYGTEGHLPVKPDQRGGGATDGPTLSGSAGAAPDGTSTPLDEIALATRQGGLP